MDRYWIIIIVKGINNFGLLRYIIKIIRINIIIKLGYNIKIINNIRLIKNYIKIRLW